MSTVVLYCWCHSDSASVLFYLTYIVLVAGSINWSDELWEGPPEKGIEEYLWSTGVCDALFPEFPNLFHAVSLQKSKICVAPVTIRSASFWITWLKIWFHHVFDVGLPSLFVTALKHFTFFSSGMHIFKHSFLCTLASRGHYQVCFSVNLQV